MNPLTNVKNVKKLSEQELDFNFKTSWHDQYKDSAWIFIGGLPYDLTEGDVICIFSQYGEIVNLNLVRDKGTGKSRGFCFLCYEDQRSTVLAVDNLNGIKVLGRILRIDHVQNYKPPKESENITEETRRLREEGCASTSQVKVKKEPPDDYPSFNDLKVNKNVAIKREKDIKREWDINKEKQEESEWKDKKKQNERKEKKDKHDKSERRKKDKDKKRKKAEERRKEKKEQKRKKERQRSSSASNSSSSSSSGSESD